MSINWHFPPHSLLGYRRSLFCLNMSDDKFPKKEDNKKKGDKKPRNRYADAANSDQLQGLLDEQDDRKLLDNLDPNPRPGGRPAETISNSASAQLQTRNDKPGFFVGPHGELYPKSEWQRVKNDYRESVLNNPLPEIPLRVREPSSIESSTTGERSSWSDEDPAFCGYGKLEEDETNGDPK